MEQHKSCWMTTLPFPTSNLFSACQVTLRSWPLLLLYGLGLALTAACQGKSPQPLPVHRLDWKVDSLLAFPLGDNLWFYKQGFMFSPFEKDKVWFAPDNSGAFELDLKSGQKTLFSERFGHAFFQKNLRIEGIQLDSFDKNVCWFLNFHEGVFRFDRASGQGQFFDIAAHRRAMSTIAFSKNHVWIGTSGGLWVYDRQAGTCRAVDYSPEIWINKIRIDSYGKLWINTDNHAYDPQVNCWERFPGNDDRPTDRPPDSTVVWKLPYAGSYASATAPNETWYCHRDYWFYRHQTASLPRAYRPPVDAQVRALLADSDHLYLLCPDTFLIVRKTYVFDHYAGDLALLVKIKRLRSLADSLQIYRSESWSEQQAKMIFLKSQFPGETDPYILAQLLQFAGYFSLPTAEKSLRSLLLDRHLDTIIAYSAYSALALHYVTAGKLRKVLALHQEIRSKRPELYFFKRRDTNLEVVKTSVHQLDSIDRTGQPAYEKLWAKGKAMQWFCVNQQYLSSNLCYNYWLADSIFRRLVRLYPQSPRADDADYELIIDNICHACEDGSDHPEEIRDWKIYLRKYPATERRAEILCAMAWALGRDLPDLRQGLRWLAEAERLRPELFADDHQMSQSGTKADFQRQLDRFEIEMSIRLKKSNVHMGEPVEIVFSVRNTAAARKKLSVRANPGVPNFTLNIIPEEAGENCVRPTTYIESQTPAYSQNDPANKIKDLPAGKTHVETWDLTKTAHKLSNPNLGRFVFDRPGVYVITAQWGPWGDGTMAAPVRLTVE